MLEIPLLLYRGATIFAIKQIVAEKTKIDSQKMILVYKKETLDDNMFLIHYLNIS